MLAGRQAGIAHRKGRMHALAARLVAVAAWPVQLLSSWGSEVSAADARGSTQIKCSKGGHVSYISPIKCG